MLARAGKKARKAGVEIVFKNGIVQALPFPDGQFDAVLSTVMLHHLIPNARQLRELFLLSTRSVELDFENGQRFEYLCGERTQLARELLLNEHR
jgi:ubiquinone/menaquinone biosynthesis C-methylase UbiE